MSKIINFISFSIGINFVLFLLFAWLWLESALTRLPGNSIMFAVAIVTVTQAMIGVTHLPKKKVKKK